MGESWNSPGTKEKLRENIVVISRASLINLKQSLSSLILRGKERKCIKKEREREREKGRDGEER